jgi:hypothetical protein
MTKFEDSFDFGFTTHSENEFKTRENQIAKQVKDQAATDAQAKVEQMYDMILPLLINLKKDADTQEYIRWPNRGKIIDDFIKKLDAVKGK